MAFFVACKQPYRVSTYKCAVVIPFLFVIYYIIIKSTLDKLFDAISFGCTLVFDSGKRIRMVWKACPFLFGCIGCSIAIGLLIVYLRANNVAIPSAALTLASRLQNSPYFCVFKYARAVKQKVWNEVENRERDWGAWACEARALRARKTLTPRFTDFFTDFEKKTDCFAV